MEVLGRHYGCCKLAQKGELILGLTYQKSKWAQLFCLQNQAFTAFKVGLEADNLEGI